MTRRIRLPPPARKAGGGIVTLGSLIREDYEIQKVQKLIEKIRDGLGHWLTFVTEPDVNSTNDRAERALREQVVLRKMLRTLRSAERVQIHETIMTMLATWKRRGLDLPEQFQSILKSSDQDEEYH